MKKVKLISAAKINLSLDVAGLREDGYHLIRTVMQSVSLFDVLKLEKKGRKGEIRLSCSLPFVPTDERNVAYKAALKFFEHTGLENEGLSVFIRKKIPVGAGLAGGSGDAAAVIRGLAALYELPLEYEELGRICSACGADVAFCSVGGTMLCEGIGDLLTPLTAMPETAIVLAKPRMSVSTRKVYGLYDELGAAPSFYTDQVIKRLAAGDVAGHVGNCLRPVTERLCPQVRGLIEVMREQGALGAEMTGSGPAVFGLFDSDEAAAECAGLIKKSNSDFYVHTVKPVDFGVKIVV